MKKNENEVQKKEAQKKPLNPKELENVSGGRKGAKAGRSTR